MLSWHCLYLKLLGRLNLALWSHNLILHCCIMSEVMKWMNEMQSCSFFFVRLRILIKSYQELVLALRLACPRDFIKP